MNKKKNITEDLKFCPVCSEHIVRESRDILLSYNNKKLQLSSLVSTVVIVARLF